ncbi:CBS domain-containing protein [Pseudochrobactrum sp. sp1633]|uniref:CBS domain-containing protein n=1 Tax=Pseudochrobactrum sp. sp1633 TaxID=3036706 RepID=UPI0025A5061E|nr:CBS domain-containing protein [Pseudochrobactrum sp. sp1633]MDM8343884.1 CBS domain-containing protein [Pseudochrobactrum sp. sp1633]HWD11724.1 CBS domain-containing protein [Pseudochrobactrum sp.]
MTVRAILEQKGSDVYTVKADADLETAAKQLSAHRIGALLVDEGAGKYTGILSERDIVRACANHGIQALQMPVSKTMTTKVLHCSPHDTVHYVMEMMTRHRFRHLPVVDESGELVGIISIGDVVKRRIEQAEQETAEMIQYIATA